MNKRTLLSLRILLPALSILVLLNLALLIGIGAPSLLKDGSLFPHAPLSGASVQPEIETSLPTPESTLEPTATYQPTATIAPVISDNPQQDEGLIVLSMRDGNFSHLFAYHPQHLPLTRLTDSAWDDIHPALSPDGARLAFSSRRNGYWNLYVLDLADNTLSSVTDTLEYDGYPSWSPDGQWLAYESYVDDQLDLFIRSMTDPEYTPIRLTEDPGLDHSPHWSPDGRRIAFVSTRSGEEEIWMANLDQVDERFLNISRNSESLERAPRWSPDGRYLAWSSEREGESTLMVWDQDQPLLKAVPVGLGHYPIWSPDGQTLLTEIHMPNRTALAGYTFSNRSLRFPAQEFPGAIYGMEWKAGQLTELIQRMPLSEYAALPAGPLWLPVRSLDPPPPDGRQGVVPLEDTTAPFAYLHDAVDESFRAMRDRIGIEAGWDLLSSLESAYIPLTEAPAPTMDDNWLMTGRGFTLNPMPLHAGWMLLIKEDFNGQTYWRVYLKARYQDGSLGLPVTQSSWDLNARYTGGSRAYEAGGRAGAVPSGYWIDFTELASRYGWERMPALNNWRTFYPAARFNQFILPAGLDWPSAMAEVYPPEALMTATPVPTPTATLTTTPKSPARLAPTASATQIPTQTLTNQPTWTPAP
jgi:TolB protein